MVTVSPYVALSSVCGDDRETKAARIIVRDIVMTIWQGIGALVGGYTLSYGLHGEVQAKSGTSWATVCRAHAPGQHWMIIGIYTLLTLALFFMF